MRHLQNLFTLLLLLALAACSTKRTFEPPLRAESGQLQIEVRKVQHKKKYLRIWVSLINKTDDTLVLGYGDFYATAGEKRLKGALRVPFVRIDKEFDMHPKMHKRVSQPIEFIGFGGDALPKVQLELKNIRVKGQTGSSELSIEVPVTAGG